MGNFDNYFEVMMVGKSAGACPFRCVSSPGVVNFYVKRELMVQNSNFLIFNILDAIKRRKSGMMVIDNLNKSELYPGSLLHLFGTLPRILYRYAKTAHSRPNRTS